MTEWISARELADVLGQSHTDNVTKEARRRGWPRRTQRDPTGQLGVWFEFAAVRPDWQAAVLRARVLRAAECAVVQTPRGDGSDWATSRMAAVAAWERWVAGAEEPEIEATAAFCRLWNEQGRPPSVSRSSLYEWRRWVREGESERLSAAPEGGRKQVREWPAGFREELCALVLHGNGVSVATAYEEAIRRYRAEQGDAEFPSLRTVTRYFENLPKAVLQVSRQGKKRFDDGCGTYVLRDFSLLAPNELWISDHHQLDFFCADPDTGRPIRPWLTAWQDARSRKVVGFTVSVQPNSGTVLSALAMGVVTYGLPDHILVDNGKDFRSQTLFWSEGDLRRLNAVGAGVHVDEFGGRTKPLSEHLQITPHFALPYVARTKPIERLFGTVKGKFSRLQDYFCGGKPGERPEDLFERLAKLEKQVARTAGRKDLPPLPTLWEVHHDFQRWVEEVYHARPHSSLADENPALTPATPNTVYTAAFKGVRRELPAAKVAILFMRATLPRKVRDRGVELDGQWYDAPELAMRHGQEVYLRYDPMTVVEDAHGRPVVSEVHVFQSGDADKWLCTAALVAKQHPLQGSQGDLGAQLEGQRVERKAALAAVQAQTGGKRFKSRLDTTRALLLRGEQAPAPEVPGAQVVALVQPQVDSPEAVKAAKAERKQAGERLAQVHELAAQRDAAPRKTAAQLWGEHGRRMEGKA